MKNKLIRCAIALTLALGAHVHAQNMPAAAAAATQGAFVSAEDFKKFEGNYQLTPTMLITIFQKDGKFLAQGSGQGSFEIYADSATSFYAKVADIKINFVLGSDGVASQFTATQNGRPQPTAMRVK